MLTCQLKEQLASCSNQSKWVLMGLWNRWLRLKSPYCHLFISKRRKKEKKCKTLWIYATWNFCQAHSSLFFCHLSSQTWADGDFCLFFLISCWGGGGHQEKCRSEKLQKCMLGPRRRRICVCTFRGPVSIHQSLLAALDTFNPPWTTLIQSEDFKPGC